MKTCRPAFTLLTALALLILVVGLASSSDARSRWSSGTARLYIKRSPDLGNLAYVAVRLDGREIGGILWAHDFDWEIPAGRHLIEVQLGPAEYTYSPSAMILDARPGGIYSFMAMKKGGALVLGRY